VSKPGDRLLKALRELRDALRDKKMGKLVTSRVRFVRNPKTGEIIASRVKENP
jgi:hypothetical protein